MALVLHRGTFIVTMVMTLTVQWALSDCESHFSVLFQARRGEKVETLCLRVGHKVI